MSGSSSSDQLDRDEPPFAEPVLRERAELVKRAVSHRFEPASLGGEDDAKRAPVIGSCSRRTYRLRLSSRTIVVIVCLLSRARRAS